MLACYRQPGLSTLHQSLARASSRHQHQRLAAGLGLLEGVSRAVELATVAGIATGVVNSLKSYSPSLQQGSSGASQEPDSDGVQWGVMSLVSLFPWFNSLARPPHESITDEERRKTYIAFTAVYSLPLLQHGLSFDGYVLACVLACAVHVQVERLVRTEPDTFRQLGLDDLARKLQLPQSVREPEDRAGQIAHQKLLEQQERQKASDLASFDKLLDQQEQRRKR